jgi:hypothetical protein
MLRLLSASKRIPLLVIAGACCFPLLAIDALAAGASRTVFVEIAEGLVYEVRLQPFPARAASAGKRFLEDLPSLKRLADLGDGTAVTRIYEGLLVCRRAHKSRLRLDYAVALFRAERKLLTAEMSTPIVVVSDMASDEIVAAELTGPFDFCSGVDDRQIKAAPEWLGRAVELRDEVAVSYALEHATDNEERMRLLVLLWQLGDATALGGLADLFFERAQSADGAPGDLTSAYAHQLLYVRLSETARLVELGPIRARLLGEARERLIRLERLLSPGQVATGKISAATLLASNGSKCFPL